jgi:hypothetical protein
LDGLERYSRSLAYAAPCVPRVSDPQSSTRLALKVEGLEFRLEKSICKLYA